MKEGKPEAESLIGEREPLEDETVSHGICPTHRKQVAERTLRLREDIRQQAERQRAEAEELRQRVDP